MKDFLSEGTVSVYHSSLDILLISNVDDMISVITVLITCFMLMFNSESGVFEDYKIQWFNVNYGRTKRETEIDSFSGGFMIV